MVESIVRNDVKDVVGKEFLGKVRLLNTLYYSESNHFGIFAVSTHDFEATEDGTEIAFKDNAKNSIIIKGNVPKLDYGKNYTVKLIGVNDKKYGLGYDVKMIYQDVLDDISNQKTFLSTFLTEKQVEEIYKIYDGQNVVKLIVDREIDYTKVKGVGGAIAESIYNKVIENLKYQQAIIELCDKYELSLKIIKKLVDQYENYSVLIEKVKENPYILADEINGIGFIKADEIALNNGVEKTDDKRIHSCIYYLIKEQASLGNSWCDRHSLISEASDMLMLSQKKIAESIIHADENSLIKKFVTITDERIFANKYLKIEKSILNHINRINSSREDDEKEAFFKSNINFVESQIFNIEEEQGFSFTSEQKKAVIDIVLKDDVHILTGKAGTGKTAVIKAVIKIYLLLQDKIHKTKIGTFDNYFTCALSGKASQRITESTGFRSSTIHRLLNYNPQLGGFQIDFDNQLNEAIIVLDEASMVDCYLVEKLIQSVKTGSKLVIVGDIEQLESIGVGNFLGDLLDSELVGKTVFTIVHRQAQLSGILSSANEVREGKLFFDSSNLSARKIGDLQDLIFYPYKKDEKEKILMQVLKVAKSYKRSEKSILDFQVMCALKERGELSVFTLNMLLQEVFNPKEEYLSGSIKKGKMEFRENDKVIQNVNNYDLEVFNGNIGIIKMIDTQNKKVIIDFEGIGERCYEYDMMGQIDLAYAITVHKMQGGQVKNCLFAFDFSAYQLLSRQLIYTALTRAMKIMYLVCDVDALCKAIRTDKKSKRNTFLIELIEEYIATNEGKFSA